MNSVAQQIYSATPAQNGHVLIADDQQHILAALQLLLGGCGFRTESVTHPDGLLELLQTAQFDAVVMDLNYTRDTTSGGEGLELVSKIRSMDTLVPILVMTAWSNVELAVEAMRRGASDFVQKPWRNQDLTQKLRTQVSLARARRRVQCLNNEEQQEAREIQQSLMPKKLPEVAGYELAAVTRPLRFVGGDYYSIVPLSDRHTAVCIADVAGKGLPAALLMSSLHSALKPLISQKISPAELCTRLNRILCDITPLGKFISFFYVVLDNQDHTLTYCNAGHNLPVLMRRDGSCTELSAAGAVLGQFPRWVYSQSELEMKIADKLLLFTDGLVDACNDKEESFGEDNLMRVARENSSSAAENLMQTLMSAASRHCEDDFQDDCTVIVVEATAKRQVIVPRHNCHLLYPEHSTP